MPSKARKSFDANVRDIDRLIELHSQIGGKGPGRRYGLEVLNKAAIVLITAFWESYCEDIAAEGLEHLVKEASSADALPVPLKQQIAKELKDNTHQLAVWDICDDKWRAYLLNRLAKLQEDRNRKLNTPKSEQIDDLFKSAVGIEKISDAWNIPAKNITATQSRDRLNYFVIFRGAIAHRGKHETSVKLSHVEEYFELVKNLAARTGGRVNRHAKSVTGKFLWT